MPEPCSADPSTTENHYSPYSMTSTQGNQPRIPLVICEDDIELRAILVAGLAHFGIDAFGVGDGEALTVALLAHRPSVVVLDIGLPGEDGRSIARRLSSEGGQRLGIIMLTARGALEDRIGGMRDGADAYFVKPVDLRELACAVQNLHRRVSPVPDTSHPEGAYRLDALHSTLALPTGERISLTATELRVLQLLALNPGEVVERADLLRNLQQPLDPPAMQRLETHISRLRGKIRQVQGAEPLPIQASHGVGYTFLAPLRLQP